MEKSWRASSHGVIAKLGLFLVLVGGVSSAVSSSGDISTRALTDIFRNTNLETARDPVTYEGRQGIRIFLSNRLSSIVSSTGRGGGFNKNEFLQQTFQTKMFETRERERVVVDGTNYLAIFKGSKDNSEDVPLIILANYDTDEAEDNPVDDNGSGIVALIALAEHVSHQISRGQLVLEHTLIFAATDVALNKYEYGLPSRAQTGAEVLVRGWLPKFMESRARFGGAIVLDSIMNYNDEPNSQTQHDGHFSKAFPFAYSEMSKRSFKGDFLAMVYRDEDIDTPLVNAFERGWQVAKKSGSSLVDIDPGLIRFAYDNSTFSAHAPSAIHFLRSEQTPFWNNFVQDVRVHGEGNKKLPAVLITDTDKYRKAECTAGCTVRKMVDESPKNVELLRRTVNALYATIIELQVDGYKNSGSKTEFSLTLAAVMGLALSRLFL